MLKLISSNKIIFLGIFLIIIQTFFGASFDTATKFLGSNNNLLWYHYYALGLSLPMIFFIFFLIISKNIKKNYIALFNTLLFNTLSLNISFRDCIVSL